MSPPAATGTAWTVDCERVAKIAIQKPFWVFEFLGKQPAVHSAEVSRGQSMVIVSVADRQNVTRDR